MNDLKPMSKQNERRDAAATDWCIEKGAYHFEHLAYESGYDRALTDLKQQVGLDESADLEAVINRLVKAVRDLGCICPPAYTEERYSCPCCNFPALAPFRKDEP